VIQPCPKISKARLSYQLTPGRENHQTPPKAIKNDISLYIHVDRQTDMFLDWET
jgi:hypothetical protein